MTWTDADLAALPRNGIHEPGEEQMTERIEIYPFGMHDMNEATGLPAVPEGMFWRVRKSIHPFAGIELRRRARFGSRKVVDVTVKRTELAAPDRILVACALALHKAREEAAFRPLASVVYGDYPPNRIAPSTSLEGDEDGR